MGWLDSITDSMDMNLSKYWEIEDDRRGKPGMLQSMGLQRVGRDLVTEQQQSAVRVEAVNQAARPAILFS